jgi:POT family proton-dependent oligopeptide transporter
MDKPVPVVVPLLGFVTIGVGFIYYWPTLLGLTTRVSPQRVQATMMGVVFMSLFASYLAVGWLGGLYDKMPASEFWLVHVVIGIAGGVLALLLKRPLERVLR